MNLLGSSMGSEYWTIFLSRSHNIFLGLLHVSTLDILNANVKEFLENGKGFVMNST